LNGDPKGDGRLLKKVTSESVKETLLVQNNHNPLFSHAVFLNLQLERGGISSGLKKNSIFSQEITFAFFPAARPCNHPSNLDSRVRDAPSCDNCVAGPPSTHLVRPRQLLSHLHSQPRRETKGPHPLGQPSHGMVPSRLLLPSWHHRCVSSKLPHQTCP